MACCLFPNRNHSGEILSRGSSAGKAEDARSQPVQEMSASAACRTGLRAGQKQPSERRGGHAESWAPFLWAARRHRVVYLGTQHGQLEFQRSPKSDIVKGESG